MKCLAIATFLLFLQVGTPQDSTFRMKAIPEAPRLPALDYNSLPEYVRYLIAPTESMKENKANTVKTTSEATTKIKPKTYGMSIVNDRGVIWSDLNKWRTFYEVGETEEKRENNKVQKETDNEIPSRNTNRITKNDVNKAENIKETNKAINNQDNSVKKTDKEIHELENKSQKKVNSPKTSLKAGTSSKNEPTTYRPISEKRTINHDNNRTKNENNTDVKSKPESLTEVKVDESITNSVTSNRTEKLMKNLEKAVNEFITDMNATSNPVLQDKSSNCNSTSDVPKIHVSELQIIFDDIIKNYTSVFNANTTIKEYDSIINTDLDSSKNRSITEATTNKLDVDSDIITVGYPTTESMTTVEEMTNKDNIDSSTVKEHVDSKSTDEVITKDSDIKKENQSNRTINNNGILVNPTDFLKELIDDGKFQQLMDRSTAKILKPFIERIGREIRDEVTTQLHDYFESIKNNGNQSKLFGNCPNVSNSTTIKAEDEKTKDTNDNNDGSTVLIADSTTELPTTIAIEPFLTVDEKMSKLSMYINESYNNRSMELNQTSDFVNPKPQNIYICEACKVIFNMNSNVTNKYLNTDRLDSNDIFIKKKSKEELNTTEVKDENNSYAIKTSPIKDDRNTTGNGKAINKIGEQNGNTVNKGDEFFDTKFVQFTTEAYLDRDERDNANYRHDLGTINLESGKSNNGNVLLGRSPYIRLPRLRPNL